MRDLAKLQLRKALTQLLRLSEQTKLLFAKEIEEHKKKRDLYYLKKEEYNAYKENKKEARTLEVERIKQRIISYFNSEKERKKIKLNWKVLPPGKCSIGQITNHFKILQESNSKYEYDFKRLELMETLKPATCYIGLEEFDGYIVFCFNYTSRAILENPIKGNAIYVISNNWVELSKLTKGKLLSCHSDKISRIIHRGDWFGRLKSKICSENRGNGSKSTTP